MAEQQPNNPQIDYAQLATAVASALQNSQANSDWETEHRNQHATIAVLIPYAPLIVEMAEELRERRERRKRLIEKVTGFVVVAAAGAFLTWLGAATLKWLHISPGW